MQGFKQSGTLAWISQIMWVQLQFNKMEVIAYLAELLDLNVILICFVHCGSETALAVWQKTMSVALVEKSLSLQASFVWICQNYIQNSYVHLFSYFIFSIIFLIEYSAVGHCYVMDNYSSLGVYDRPKRPCGNIENETCSVYFFNVL